MDRLTRLRRLSGFTAAALALAAIAEPAFAADLPLAPAPLPAAPVNWTGFYLGGDVGAVFNETLFSRPLIPGFADTAVGNIDPRPTYGLYGGFNYQVTPWAVLGIEGNYNWLSNAYYRELGFPKLDFLDQSHYVTSVGLRGGLMVRPGTMVYAKVGPAWINVAGINGFGVRFDEALPAVQVGFGIESLVTQNIAVRAEASYTFSDQYLSLNAGFDLYRPSVMMLQIGAAYKFDPPEGWGAPMSARIAPEHWTYPTLPLPAFPPNPPLPMVVKGDPAAAPVPAPDPRWTGVEAGGFFSANGNQVRYFDTLVGTQGPYTSFNIGGGWFAGFNLQIQRFVIGFEGSGNYENANFGTAAGSGGVVNFYRFANIDRVLAVTGRAGWLTTPDTLLYVKAGPAEMTMATETNYWTSIAPNATGPLTYPGYVAGIGAETFLLPNFSIRVEGLYTHSDRTVVLNGPVPNEFMLQPSILSGTLGAALHF